MALGHEDELLLWVSRVGTMASAATIVRVDLNQVTDYTTTRTIFNTIISNTSIINVASIDLLEAEAGILS